jgi:hypothetical protein
VNFREESEVPVSEQQSVLSSLAAGLSEAKELGLDTSKFEEDQRMAGYRITPVLVFWT